MLIKTKAGTWLHEDICMPLNQSIKQINICDPPDLLYSNFKLQHLNGKEIEYKVSHKFLTLIHSCMLTIQSSLYFQRAVDCKHEDLKHQFDLTKPHDRYERLLLPWSYPNNSMDISTSNSIGFHLPCNL